MKRQGREPAINLSVEEWDEIRRIADEIMEAVMAGSTTHQSGQASMRRHIEIVLARNVAAAAQMYGTQAAEEETHRQGTVPGARHHYPDHPISACSPDFCGRYAGQRRQTEFGPTDESPGYRSARGAVPREPGSPRAEDVIRKLRDESQ